MKRGSQHLRVGVISLGCPKTLVDSEVILGKLQNAGYAKASSIDQSDIVLLNTCGFIKDAQQESVDTLLRLVEYKREGKILALIALGCLVQRFPDEIQSSFKDVDAFIGSGDFEKVPQILKKVLAGKRTTHLHHLGYLSRAGDSRVPLTPQHSRYLKISEGCNHTCSFCVIPSLRGRFRSRKISDVLQEAKQLAAEGAKELILIGQDTTKFGYDYAKKPLLPELLSELERIGGVRWIRLLYAYPSSVSDALIHMIATSKKICHYIDLPLQHISDKILHAMRRGMNKKKTVELIKKLRIAIPDLVIRTSFIVGFPGETEQDFRELLDFMDEMKFERVGIFTYSREKGSRAAKFPGQVPEPVKEARFHQAMLYQQAIVRRANRRLLGKTFDVLIEKRDAKKRDVWLGRSYMDAPEVDGNVIVCSSKTLKVGNFYPVQIKDAKEYDLVGKI